MKFKKEMRGKKIRAINIQRRHWYAMWSKKLNKKGSVNDLRFLILRLPSLGNYNIDDLEINKILPTVTVSGWSWS